MILVVEGGSRPIVVAFYDDDDDDDYNAHFHQSMQHFIIIISL